MYHNNVLYCYLTYFNVYRRMFFFDLSWYMAQWKLGGQLCRSGDDLLASSCSAWSSTIARNRPGPTPSICWTIFYIWYISLVSIFSLACKILFVCTTIYIYIHSFWFASIYRSSKSIWRLGKFSLNRGWPTDPLEWAVGGIIVPVGFLGVAQ